MKRMGSVYEKLLDIDLIKEAIRNASRNKRDRKSVQRVLSNIDEYASRIQKMLADKTFKPSGYRTIEMYDGFRRKKRLISKPSFYPDQIVHWAIYLAIRDWIYKGFYYYTCGSVPGKGVHFGKKYVERWIQTDRKNTKYYLKMDIRHFYQSIDPHRLMVKLNRKFKDSDLSSLLESILYQEDGLPIGMLLSQVFANFYLTDFDYWIKQTLKAKYYIRYMDDMVIFSASKRLLHGHRAAIASRLQDDGLELKQNWQVCRLDKEPLDFMGFRFYRDRTTIRKSIMFRISRRVRRASKKRKISPRDASAIISYLGWVKATDSYGFYMKYIKPYISIARLKAVVRSRNESIQHGIRPQAA